MHFLVLGAGAIGCYVGGRLAARWPGRHVGDRALLQPIAAQGLRVTDLDGTTTRCPLAPRRCGWRPPGRCSTGRGQHRPAVRQEWRHRIRRTRAGGRVCRHPSSHCKTAWITWPRIQALAPGLGACAVAGMVPYNVVLRGAHVHAPQRATCSCSAIRPPSASHRSLPPQAWPTVLPPTSAPCSGASCCSTSTTRSTHCPTCPCARSCSTATAAACSPPCSPRPWA